MNYSFKSTTLVAAGLLLLLQKPSIFMRYDIPLFGIVAILLILQLPSLNLHEVRFKKWVFVISTVILAAYALFQSIVLDLIPLSVAIKWSVLVAMPAFFILCLDQISWHLVLKGITFVTVAFSVSHLVTTLAVLFTGNVDILRLGAFGIDLGDGFIIPYGWHFPITFTYYDTVYPVVGNISLHRVCGFMREPGLFQIFPALAFYTVGWLGWKYQMLWRLLFTLNLLLTQSTTGFAVFCAVCLYSEIFAKRDARVAVGKLARMAVVFFNLALLAAVLYFAFFGEEVYSFTAKLQTTSGVDRVERLEEAQEVLSRYPWFGAGILNSNIADQINFIGASAQIGLVGIFIWSGGVISSIYLAVIRRSPIAILGIAPVLTALISQPMYSAPVCLVLVGMVASAEDNWIKVGAPVSIRYPKHAKSSVATATKRISEQHHHAGM